MAKKRGMPALGVVTPDRQAVEDDNEPLNWGWGQTLVKSPKPKHDPDDRDFDDEEVPITRAKSYRQRPERIHKIGFLTIEEYTTHHIRIIFTTSGQKIDLVNRRDIIGFWSKMFDGDSPLVMTRDGSISEAMFDNKGQCYNEQNYYTGDTSQ